jgi:hypothetical protein
MPASVLIDKSYASRGVIPTLQAWQTRDELLVMRRLSLAGQPADKSQYAGSAGVDQRPADSRIPRPSAAHDRQGLDGSSIHLRKEISRSQSRRIEGLTSLRGRRENGKT